ncbi:glycoside hydrolase family 27 protein [Streptomyces sp. ID05-26A]|nr:glycoside hydrolase family 27 protein [Streptomyces sp. ID05-26A]
MPRTLLSVATIALALLAPTAVATAAPSAPVEHAGVDQGAPTYYDSGLARTPYMGWNSYFAVGAASEEKVLGVADHLVSSGLAKAGYNIVWIDGGWNASPPRDGKGSLVPDPARFPSGFTKLVDTLHAKGLKAGIYTDAGAWDGKNCAAGSGGGYYEADAKQFAGWKFDAIKIDFLCGIAQNMDPAVAFTQFSAAVRKAGRKMILNLCNPVTDEWGVPHRWDQTAYVAYTYGPRVGDSWRTSTDVAFGTPYEGIWRDVLRNMDRNLYRPGAQGPGHYNDPDYLIPMRKTEQGTYELNEEESTSQLVMWSVMASPLIIGSDPRTLPPSMIETLKNPEIIAVDQDPLAIQGVRVAGSNNVDVYSKVLSGKGERAVAVLNRNDQPAEYAVGIADTGLKGTVSVRDLRARADRGTATGTYTVTVPAHGTAFLRLRGETAVPGTDLGGETSASPALIRWDDRNLATFAREESGRLTQRSMVDGEWRNWVVLGGPRGGQVLGQPSAFASPNGRIDLFVRGTDNVAYQRTFANGKWGGWTSLGGSLTDSVSVAFTGPDSWSLFGRGADGRVWTRDKANSTWTSVGSPGNQQIYGRPSAATVASGTFVTVRLQDDSAWYRKRTANGWSAWTSLGGVISGSPTAVANGDRVNVFVRGSDYTLWQQDLVDGAGTWWTKRDQFVSNALTGAVGGAAGADGSTWVAVRGPDNAVHVSSLTAR